MPTDTTESPAPAVERTEAAPARRRTIVSSFSLVDDDELSDPSYEATVVLRDAPGATVIAVELAEIGKQVDLLLMGAKVELARAEHPQHRAFLGSVVEILQSYRTLQDAVDASLKAAVDAPPPTPPPPLTEDDLDDVA